MPQLGLGLMRFGSEAMTQDVIRHAFDVGYRLFDTAAVYGNETQTGEALRKLGVTRDRFFVTTKLWNASQVTDAVRKALASSLDHLGLACIDLYLIHWPLPMFDRYVATWKTLIELQAEGYIRSIGVSNFTQEQIIRLIEETGIVPAVNQVELHPYFPQRPLRAFHERHGIITQAWSPFGGGGSGATGRLLNDTVIASIAKKHECHPVQVILAWHLTHGLSVIPKATSTTHLRQNMAATDITLDAEDMDALALLERKDGRVGPDPVTLDMIHSIE